MELLRLHKAILKLLQILLLSSLVLCDLTSLNESLDLSYLPSDFLFGTASSSYQYEGAYLTDGKGLNNWDVYTHRSGNNILDGSSGDVAVDHYHLYLEDINLMSSLGVNSYRFSISWTRILPKGKFGEVNQAGIEFYNKLINALLHKGIEPFVTLNHFDFPHELEERYGGWLSSKSQKDFDYFAEICFKSYGDRVKNWVTLNEPNLQTDFTYRTGKYPPCRCSWPFGNCTAGDSEKEPFVAAHNLILSHAAAVSTYRTKYQKEQGGKIGIVVHIPWFEPISNSTADELAAERAQSFFTKWFLDPIIFGKYPADMEKTLGSLLPKFSTSDKEKLKMAGVDFIGINHYTSYYVQDCIYSPCEAGVGVTWSEGSYRRSSQRNGVPIGEPSSLDWLNVYPRGMEKTVEFVMETYNNIPMIITENGFGTFDNPNTTVEELLVDAKRVSYMADYLDALLRAMRKGADVRGYFVWSLLDDFEWLYGYTARFGLYYVDYGSLNRTRKSSATWYERLISRHKDNVLILPKKDGTSASIIIKSIPDGAAKSLSTRNGENTDLFNGIIPEHTNDHYRKCNGTIDNPNSTIEKIVQDLKRVKYMTEYFDAMLRAMRNGADVRGYYVWSLLENFEWLSGHKGRFGLHHVDYATLNRTRKSSARRYKRFIARHKEKVLQLPKQNGNNFQY